MEKVNDIGKFYSTDVLIIGGSIAGLTAAIKAKEANGDLDVLVVDKGTIGWSGQAAKAGNGYLASAADQPPERFAEFMTRENGEYLNDQEFLIDHMSTSLKSAEFLDHCGVRISKNSDGTIKIFRQPNDMWGNIGIELFNIRSLRKYALKVGVRLLSRVQVFELLTNGGRVIGGIGFDVDHMQCHVFHAKAVSLATHGAHFKKMGGMFMAYGNGLAAAYRVGAQMRNAEFSTEVDVVSKAVFQPIYGAYNIIHNKNGENISHKYAAPDSVECNVPLVLGMYKEVQEGRGPLYADLLHPDPVRIFVGAQGHVNDQRIFPDKKHWSDHVKKKTAKYGKPLTEQPEATIRLNLQVECLRVDRQHKTNVPGLWAAGKIGAMGSAYFGFVRGDGLGYAVQSGMRVGDSIAEYASTATLPDLDMQQVEALKEKIYAPLNRKGGRSPLEIFSIMEDYAFHLDKLVSKSESRIERVLKQIEEMYAIVPELTAEDAHSLAKCHEAADSILALEMVFRAAGMRKESRCFRYRHHREDYPQRDDANWLKWICIRQGENGEMELFTEDVPIDRYPFKPEGYKSPAAAQ